eukprot:TRINITY_DN16947_c0_g2_i1.p1 TRINITY_DN16947_c0_g2~~TRINITY_DN16947_c0_g2_i1.p1  ORF type:complete len:1399 (+),score=361.76 TRINITY_DN16947_c0_g2_i1:67-4197(+)
MLRETSFAADTEAGEAGSGFSVRSPKLDAQQAPLRRRRSSAAPIGILDDQVVTLNQQLSQVEDASDRLEMARAGIADRQRRIRASFGSSSAARAAGLRKPPEKPPLPTPADDVALWRRKLQESAGDVDAAIALVHEELPPGDTSKRLAAAVAELSEARSEVDTMTALLQRRDAELALVLRREEAQVRKLRAAVDRLNMLKRQQELTIAQTTQDLFDERTGHSRQREGMVLELRMARQRAQQDAHEAQDGKRKGIPSPPSKTEQICSQCFGRFLAAPGAVSPPPPPSAAGSGPGGGGSFPSPETPAAPFRFHEKAAPDGSATGPASTPAPETGLGARRHQPPPAELAPSEPGLLPGGRDSQQLGVLVEKHKERCDTLCYLLGSERVEKTTLRERCGTLERRVVELASQLSSMRQSLQECAHGPLAARGMQRGSAWRVLAGISKLREGMVALRGTVDTWTKERVQPYFGRLGEALARVEALAQQQLDRASDSFAALQMQHEASAAQLAKSLQGSGQKEIAAMLSGMEARLRRPGDAPPGQGDEPLAQQAKRLQAQLKEHLDDCEAAREMCVPLCYLVAEDTPERTRYEDWYRRATGLPFPDPPEKLPPPKKVLDKMTQTTVTAKASRRVQTIEIGFHEDIRAAATPPATSCPPTPPAVTPSKLQQAEAEAAYAAGPLSEDVALVQDGAPGPPFAPLPAGAGAGAGAVAAQRGQEGGQVTSVAQAPQSAHARWRTAVVASTLARGPQQEEALPGMLAMPQRPERKFYPVPGPEEERADETHPATPPSYPGERGRRPQQRLGGGSECSTPSNKRPNPAGRQVGSEGSGTGSGGTGDDYDYRSGPVSPGEESDPGGNWEGSAGGSRRRRHRRGPKNARKARVGSHPEMGASQCGQDVHRVLSEQGDSPHSGGSRLGGFGAGARHGGHGVAGGAEAEHAAAAAAPDSSQSPALVQDRIERAARRIALARKHQRLLEEEAQRGAKRKLRAAELLRQLQEETARSARAAREEEARQRWEQRKARLAMDMEKRWLSKEAENRPASPPAQQGPVMSPRNRPRLSDPALEDAEGAQLCLATSPPASPQRQRQVPLTPKRKRARLQDIVQPAPLHRDPSQLVNCSQFQHDAGKAPSPVPATLFAVRKEHSRMSSPVIAPFATDGPSESFDDFAVGGQRCAASPSGLPFVRPRTNVRMDEASQDLLYGSEPLSRAEPAAGLPAALPQVPGAHGTGQPCPSQFARAIQRRRASLTKPDSPPAAPGGSPAAVPALPALPNGPCPRTGDPGASVHASGSSDGVTASQSTPRDPGLAVGVVLQPNPNPSPRHPHPPSIGFGTTHAGFHRKTRQRIPPPTAPGSTKAAKARWAAAATELQRAAAGPWRVLASAA